jgi:hypothetical protein
MKPILYNYAHLVFFLVYSFPAFEPNTGVINKDLQRCKIYKEVGQLIFYFLFCTIQFQINQYIRTDKQNDEATAG